MSQTTRNIIKTYFETGDRPTQQQFIDWLDSILWYDDPKIYVALISQSGTSAPVATVIKNTFSGTPVWSRASVGSYILTLTGEFTLNKSVMFNSSGVGAARVIGQNFPDVDRANFLVVNSSGALQDNILINSMIKIEVWP